MTHNPFHPYKPPKLTIELVPESQWYDNLRSRFTTAQWTTTKKACYALAGNRCEICGGVGKKHPVECHEIWHYDDENRVQRLDGLISLCPSCHRVKHIGLAMQQGYLMPALKHLAKVNSWPIELADEYAARSLEVWAIRSRMKYRLDLSWLDNIDAYLKRAEGAQRQARNSRADSILQMMR